MQKQKYLTVYDYGQGAVWRFLWAESETEITNAYPELEIVEVKPSWMTTERLASITECDIDSPDDFLLALKKQR